jgi:hypothetical protein
MPSWKDWNLTKSLSVFFNPDNWTICADCIRVLIKCWRNWVWIPISLQPEIQEIYDIGLQRFRDYTFLVNSGESFIRWRLFLKTWENVKFVKILAYLAQCLQSPEVKFKNLFSFSSRILHMYYISHIKLKLHNIQQP